MSPFNKVKNWHPPQYLTKHFCHPLGSPKLTMHQHPADSSKTTDRGKKQVLQNGNLIAINMRTHSLAIQKHGGREIACKKMGFGHCAAPNAYLAII